MTDIIRIRYKKTGRAKYISHLDLMAAMRRAFLRAGFQLKYSYGFNPHPYMSVALPLQVGAGSICELMDIGAEGEPGVENAPAAVNAVLPEGLVVAEAYTPERKFHDIAWIEVSGSLVYDDGRTSFAAEMIAERFAENSIIVQKKTKRGIADVDIAPHIRDLRVEDGNVLTMQAKISAQNPTLSPSMLLSAISSDNYALKPDFAVFTRIELFDSDMRVFR